VNFLNALPPFFFGAITPEYSDPDLFFLLPFLILLIAIAVLPFMKKEWWEQHYWKLSLSLGAITLAYYLIVLNNLDRIGHSLSDYVSFMCYMGSLFVISGGIFIKVKGEAKPWMNVIFLGVGALIANLIGTTGASMLLIRPWLRMNKYRFTSFHVVFFIFIVSNCGGCLTPIGDPPLFLGYLKGIPFSWVFKSCWLPWLFVNGTLLGVFFFYDRKNFLRAPEKVREKETQHEEWSFEGAHNIGFLGLILTAIFIDNPPFLREAIMVTAGIGSFITTRSTLHAKNDFNFLPIKEVAVLFLGIFLTMMPALDYLQNHSKNWDNASPLLFYFSCGSVSSVLDNAPAYLAFLSTTTGLFVSSELINYLQQIIITHGIISSDFTGARIEEINRTLAVLQQYYPQVFKGNEVNVEKISSCYLIANHELFVRAISLASVFFGALTFIGNGPNFMVKTIVEHNKMHCPHFGEYIYKYSLPILLPILIIAGYLFVR
jgi:Na+/H+ antiporter NhaD/arsenite permease-like protein